MTKGQEFLQKRGEYMRANDVDGLVANQYHDDAVMVSFDEIIKGKNAIKQHFKEYLEKGEKVVSTKVDQFVETEDSVFFSATVIRASGVTQVTDALYLKDGKIFRQFSKATEEKRVKLQK